MIQSILNIGLRIIPYGIKTVLKKLIWRLIYFCQMIFMRSRRPSVYCPIADREFKQFLKMGPYKVTPTNGAMSRHRLVWHYLLHVEGIMTKELRLLHTSPSVSFFDALSQLNNIDYVPGDKGTDGYSYHKDIEELDLTSLSYQDASFDLIVANHVLEHIPDDGSAIAEMFRVLKPGARAIITVPIREEHNETYEDVSIVSPKERAKHFGQWDHVRWYGMDIKDRLEIVGFEVDLLKYSNGFSEQEVENFGFVDDYIVVACKPD